MDVPPQVAVNIKDPSIASSADPSQHMDAPASPGQPRETPPNPSSPTATAVPTAAPPSPPAGPPPPPPDHYTDPHEKQLKAFCEWTDHQEKGRRQEALRALVSKGHSYAMSVAGALSVVSALIASALLAVLLSPNEIVLVPGNWEEVDAACIPACPVWRRVYGISGGLALVMEVTTLLITIAVAIGVKGWLELALLFFCLSLWPAAVMAMASFWLSSTLAVAVVATVLLSVFLLCSLLPQLPALTLVYFWFSTPDEITLSVNNSTPAALLLQGAGLRDVVSSAHTDELVRAQGTVPLKDVSPLHWAAQGSDSRYLQYIKSQLLHVFLLSRDPDELRDHIEMTPLMVAVYEDCLQTVQILLRAGADPNLSMGKHRRVQQIPPLFVAVQRYNDYDDIEGINNKRWLDVAKELLKYGADPNFKTTEGYNLLDITTVPMIWLLRAEGGLSCTEQEGGIPASSFVAELGKDPRVQDNPDFWHKYLVVCCREGSYNLVREVLPKVADPSLPPAGSSATALHAAAASGYGAPIIALLRESGCFQYPAVCDADGQTPLDIATEIGDSDAIRELQNWYDAIGQARPGPFLGSYSFKL